ncbi:MAG TPA: hypothetical protein VLI55_11190 [Bryobacteraceae bacterium]|nr:hypothetical protein [Bryobacteraceae bacterium]
MRSRLGSGQWEAQINPVVVGIPQPLFAAHIPFGRLDADVAK